MAGQDIYRVLDTLIHLPSLLSQGEISAREARPTSAVGINSILTLALQQSLEWRVAFPALEMAALVSFFLGLTNLLPLPALDGGRVLFVLIETVRGRRIRPEVEALVHQVGMFVLLALMLFFVVQDIVNPVVAWSLLNR
jgi:regulator of sigma E protease